MVEVTLLYLLCSLLPSHCPLFSPFFYIFPPSLLFIVLIKFYLFFFSPLLGSHTFNFYSFSVSCFRIFKKLVPPSGYTITGQLTGINRNAIQTTCEAGVRRVWGGREAVHFQVWPHSSRVTPQPLSRSQCAEKPCAERRAVPKSRKAGYWVITSLEITLKFQGLFVTSAESKAYLRSKDNQYLQLQTTLEWFMSRHSLPTCKVMTVQ